MKIIGVLLCIALVVCTVAVVRDNESKSIKTDVSSEHITVTAQELPNTVKGVWISFYEIREYLENTSEKAFISKIDDLTDKLKGKGINTVFYQLRAFCDAFYVSDIFPEDKCVNGEFDPFDIFLDIAVDKGIKVHGWINPFRVSYNRSTAVLENCPVVNGLYKEDKTNLIVCDKGIYLNPCNPKSREIAYKGVREVLDKYPVDGIHFDDYFYPETKLPTEKSYKEYKKSGGTLSVGNYRRGNISSFVSGIYSLVKSYGKEKIFSVSPCADIDKCRDVFYADVELWSSEDGYADYIIPQIYYGFNNETMPFAETVEKWEKIVDINAVTLVCGLASYKVGEEDAFAGYGKNEWKEEPDIINRQIKYIMDRDVWSGYSLFSCSYIV